jgi:hypothetical protein
MIIAESFPVTVLRLINRITYEIDLIELNRFVSGNNEFVLLNQRPAEPIPDHKTTGGQRPWGEETYKEDHDHESVALFLDTVKRIEKIVKERNWKLETKFNKYYVGLRYGFPHVFGVEWLGSRSFGIFFKVPPRIVEGIKIEGLKPHRYNKESREIVYRVEDKEYPIEKLMPLFEAPYKNITGNKL